MAMDVGSSGGKKGRSRPDMNVTPLVDVVLVLLIIFMVVTPLMHEGFRLHVPPKSNTEQAASPDEDAEQPIVVSVNGRGQIQINRDVYPDAVFPDRLRRMLVARGDRRIYFDADDNAPFERAVETLDMARGAGAAHIAISSERLGGDDG